MVLDGTFHKPYEKGLLGKVVLRTLYTVSINLYSGERTCCLKYFEF